jgi:hypothetical protein
MLRTLLVQKKSQEDECVALVQSAQIALADLVTRRRQAEEELAQLRGQTTPLLPGRRRLQEIQREESLKKRAEEAALFLTRLLTEEAEKQEALERAKSQFTLAAQERKATESALEALKKREEKARDQKQEEERDEAWRLLRSLRGVK